MPTVLEMPVFRQSYLAAAIVPLLACSGAANSQSRTLDAHEHGHGSVNLAVEGEEMVNEVMKMRQLPNGIEIKPGASAVLAPGGDHIMFMKLDDALKEGETRPVMLEFEKAGKVTLSFQVKSIADTMKLKEGHAGHKHGEHKDNH